MHGPVLILGPQRPEPNLAAALARADATGPVALISAGWRHDEAETSAIVKEFGPERPMRHLPLYRWFEEIDRAHPDLSRAYHERQRKIIAFKRAIRGRLEASIRAVDRLVACRDRDPDLYQTEISDALAHVRRLDRRIEERVAEISAAFPEVEKRWEVPEVTARREQIRDVLGEVSTVCIAGGHVGVLRNRMLFFGLEELLPEAQKQGVTLCAWSAGAMVLSERVVLFYDDPPDGRGGAEVFGPGLGLVPGFLFLPHASSRLRLDDAVRVARLVERFSPLTCITLEPGADLVLGGAGRVESHGSEGSALALTARGAGVSP